MKVPPTSCCCAATTRPKTSTSSMHGGIALTMRRLQQLQQLRRPLTEPPNPSLELDILWADPHVGLKGERASPRGVSHQFGEDVVAKVCRRLGVDMIIRGHQVWSIRFNTCSSVTSSTEADKAWRAPCFFWPTRSDAQTSSRPRQAQSIWTIFNATFAWLPYLGLIGKKFLVHEDD